MMTVKMQIILIVALAIGFIAITNMVRRKSLELRYALSWLLVAVVLMVIALVPGLLRWLSHTLGIYSEVNMVFFLGFCFLIVIVFSLTVALSRNSRRLRQLTQQVALNEEELKKLKEAMSKVDGTN